MAIRLFIMCLTIMTLSHPIHGQTISANKEAATPPLIKLSYLNYINSPTFSEPSGGSINHYLTIKRELNPDWSIAMVVRSDSNIDNGNDPHTWGNHYLKLMPPSAYDNGDLSITPQLRFYFPGSSSAQEKNIDFIFVPRTYFSSTIGKVDLTYLLIPSFYSYSVSKADQTVASHQHCLNSSYQLLSDFTIDFMACPGWTHKRNNNKPKYNELPIYPGVTKSFDNAKVSISAYAEVYAAKPQRKTSIFVTSLSYKIL